MAARAKQPTMLSVIEKHMDEGHIFPGESLSIERTSSAMFWVNERSTGRGIKLYVSETAARRAIEKALNAYYKRLEVSGAARDVAKGFPVGAKVLIDGEYPATVRGYFPDGSSSYLFPHYKIDLRGGDKNVAVPLSRVGVTKKKAVRRDPQQDDDVEAAARGMLGRYSTAKVAEEMAMLHKHDYLPGDRRHAYWKAVEERIRALSRATRRR